MFHEDLHIQVLLRHKSYFCEADLDRCFPAEQFYIDGCCLFAVVHPLNHTHGLLPDTRNNRNGIALFEIYRDVLNLDSKRLHFCLG